MNHRLSLTLAGALLLGACGEAPQEAAAPAASAKVALTVTTTTPQQLDWPQLLKASGNIAAWQEAVIGPEISNYPSPQCLPTSATW